MNALQTPMINAAMVRRNECVVDLFNFSQFTECCLLQVLCDRHFGGINYPIGGVGGIAKSLAKGLVDHGSSIMYKANVTQIITENGKAVSISF